MSYSHGRFFAARIHAARCCHVAEAFASHFGFLEILRSKLSLVDTLLDQFSNDTLWLFNIAMENSPFIVNFPIETSISEGFSMVMLNNQMVSIYNELADL